MKLCSLQNSVKRIFKISGIIAVALLLPLSSAYPDPDTMPSYVSLPSLSIAKPQAVAVNDANGKIYTTSSIEDVLSIFDQFGILESTYAIQDPVSVAVDSTGWVYLGSTNGGYVQVYNAAMTPQFKLGDGNGEFVLPYGIAIAGNGDIYVSDASTDVVKVYSSTGLYKGELGRGGSGTVPTPDGYFNEPYSLTIDEAAQEIVVLDRQLVVAPYVRPGARIQVFDISTVFNPADPVFSFGEFGTTPDVQPHTMERPHGIEVDSEGRVYVSDTGLKNQRVLIFSPSGAYLGHITGFAQPLGLEIDSEDRLYVASFNSNAVKVFQIDPPDITVTLPSFDYGNVDVGTTANTIFTVQNDGTGDLVIGTVTDPAAPFSKTSDTCTGQTIIPAATCTIDILFAPTQDTTYAGNFNIPSNDPDESSVTVALTGTGINSPPIADAGGPYTGKEGLSLVLDGSGSSDSDGTIVTYEWDFGDGSLLDYGQSVSHTYNQGGIFTVTLTVTDNDGAFDVDTTTADISDTIPTADFTGSPKSGSAPLTVNFTNNSTGYDQPLTFEWDFDNDGNTDSTAQNPSHQYTSDGTYTVKLTVTDADESTDSLTRINYITVALSAYSLTVSVNGQGSITSSPTGIDCPTDCSEQY
ncbi:MAG: PKD domain-containing protein [Planctomycetota bacterium]|jgi:PKD repeat protein